MRMGKRMLALLAAALLLIGMLPAGALAAMDIPSTVDIGVDAQVYKNDACQIEMRAGDVLYNDQLEKYTFKWQIREGVPNNGHFFGPGETGFYNCTKAEAEKLKGQNICQCAVYDGSTLVTTITYKVGDVIYAPVIEGNSSLKYLYYTPGQPLTVSVAQPYIGGNAQLEYEWVWSNNSWEPIPNSDAREITVTPGADKDGWTLYCMVRTKNYYNDTLAGEFVVKSRAENPIEMPTLSTDGQYYEIEPGKSQVLSLPAAKPGIAGKALEYRWYTRDGFELKLYKITSTPQLTLTNTAMEEKFETFRCKVGYKGDKESNFLEYGMAFDVQFLPGTTPTTPTSAPKTGDNTPLTALFLLLGISLAGATVLAGKRRGHEHS